MVLKDGDFMSTTLLIEKVQMRRERFSKIGSLVRNETNSMRIGGRFVLLVFLLFCFPVFAQELLVGDSLVAKGTFQIESKNQNNLLDKSHQFSYKKLIVPGVLVGYGVASLEVKGLKNLNYSIRDEILESKPQESKLDNFTAFAPAAIVYGLNAFGVKGKHSFKDRTALYGSSILLASAFVIPLKHIIKEERPDQSNKLSFPSGHTAYAFASAQFMFREYQDTHFLLSISGYSFAVFTAIYRMINNKHWFGDVVGGAGFGILSTELAYWLYPKIQGLFTKKSTNSTTMIVPMYQNKTFGFGLVKTF